MRMCAVRNLSFPVEHPLNMSRSNSRASSAGLTAPERHGTAAELDAAYAEASRLRTHRPEVALMAASMLRRRSEAIGYPHGPPRARLLEAWGELAGRRFMAARQAAEEALRGLRDLGDRVGTASALNVIGGAARRQGDTRRAVAAFTEALEHARAAAEPREASIALAGLAACDLAAGAGADALEKAEEAERIARASGWDEQALTALLIRGIATIPLNRYREAADLFAAARDGARVLDHRQIEAQALGNLGATAALLGDVAAALRYDLEALAMHRENGDELETAERLGNIATRYLEIGDYARAYAALRQARETFERHGQAVALGNLGMLSLTIDDPHAAVDAFERGLALAVAIVDRSAEAYARTGLGKTNEVLGRPREALLHYLKALRLNETIGNARDVSETCLGIGELYAAMGEHDEAVAFLDRALAIVRDLGLRREEATVQHARGTLELRRGNAAAALDVLEGALVIARERDAQRQQHEILSDLIVAARAAGSDRLPEYERAAEEALSRSFHQEGGKRVREMIARHQDAAIERDARCFGLRDDDIERLAAMPRREATASTARVDAVPEAEAPDVSPTRGAEPVAGEPLIRVRTLGGFGVEVNGRPLADADWGRKRSRELFKLLVARHRAWVTVDEIFDRLWGEHGGQQIEMVVMKAVSNLRKAFTGARSGTGLTVRHDNGAYLLDLGAGAQVDYLAFKELIVAARRAASAGERAVRYAEAVALYAGEFLPQDRFAEWTEFERGALGDAHAEALEFLAREHLRAGDAVEAVEHARRLAAIDPLSETACGVLIEGLRRLKREAEARRVREEYAAAYRAEMGEDPVFADIAEDAAEDAAEG